jgi:hypothetical protein
MAQAAEMRNARAAEAAARLEAKESLQAALAEVDSGLAVIGSMIGRPGVNLDVLKRAGDKRYNEQWIKAAQTLTLGADLGESVAFVAEAGSAGNLANTNKPLYDMVSGSYAAIKAEADRAAKDATRAGGKPIKPEVAWKDAADKYQATIVDSVNTKGAAQPANDAVWETKFNPFSVPHAVLVDEITAGQIPGLANNVVAKTVSNLIASKGGGDLAPADEALIFKTVVEQIKNGTIGPAAAADQYAAYYNVGAAKAVDMYATTTMGLPTPHHYYMELPISQPNVFGRFQIGREHV